MKLPSPQELAQAIAQTSLSDTEKKEILQQLPYLSEDRITELYESLLELSRKETEVIREAGLVDLKYQLKLQKEIEKARTGQH